MTPTWIFDLDDTLHDAGHAVFPFIHQAMNSYIMQRLNLNETDAQALRLHYWRRYGATLKGLVHHHDVDAADFLAKTHPLDELLAMLSWDSRIHLILQRLPGRKYILSNGPRRYVNEVLRHMMLGRYFDGIYTVEDSGFHPKPHRQAFRALLAAERLKATRCIMVEDSLGNLRTAKELGMRTIWLSQTPRRPSYVDLRLRSLGELLNTTLV